MKLKINNFAMIKKAEIEIDGITVIAGQNNTGKSTIGKILFSLFNSLYDIDKKVDQKRINEIREALSGSIRNYILHTNDEKNMATSDSRRLSNDITAEISNYIMESAVETLDKFKLIDIVDEVLRSYDIHIYKKDINEIIELVSDKVFTTINLSNNSIVREIISRYFDKIFYGQMNYLNKERADAKLELIIKNKKISVSFKNNECIKYEPNYNILHEAFYIDNPFIIDDISANPRNLPFSYRGFDDIKNHIIAKLTSKNNIMDGIINAVIAKEKLEEIYKVLNRVVEGNIVVNSGTFGLDTNSFSEPVKLANLSTGLKSFIIIKMLLEKGILKEKDIIILDEPEIHLHPEWQLSYAEIIVLLQKIFDLSIVVTTHSSNFLESIDYFSRKHSIDSKCKYYISTSNNGINSFEEVTDNLDKIYAQMIESSVLLDKLKYEMENDENE